MLPDDNQEDPEVAGIETTDAADPDSVGVGKTDADGAEDEAGGGEDGGGGADAPGEDSGGDGGGDGPHRHAVAGTRESGSQGAGKAGEAGVGEETPESAGKSVAPLSDSVIERCFKECDGSIYRIALVLGMDRAEVRKRLKKMPHLQVIYPEDPTAKVTAPRWQSR